VTRGFLTIAYGNPRYLQMAKGMARSMRFHSGVVKLAVVTDAEDADLRELFDNVVPFNPAFGSGVAQKLHVDRYSPYDQTLFVDSDSLAFSDPELLWEMFRDSSGFGVKGWSYLTAEDSHYAIDDMGKALEACAVGRLGAFNSGLFYFDRTVQAQKVFSTAREIADRGGEIGLKEFKNSPCADEPVFALALEMNSIPMLPWDAGRAMCTATADDIQGLEAIDVFTGHCALIRYQTLTEPVILHFHLNAQTCFPYARELWRLRLGVRGGRGILPSICAVPGFLAAQIRYLSTRATLRIRQHGLAGLIPQRFERYWKRHGRLSNGSGH